LFGKIEDGKDNVETVGAALVVALNGMIIPNGTVATNRDCRLYGRMAFVLNEMVALNWLLARGNICKKKRFCMLR